MNIDGIQIPAHLVNIITARMTELVAKGMPMDVDTLHYAVAIANDDVQNIGMEMLTDDRHDGAIRNRIAAEVHADLNQAAAA